MSCLWKGEDLPAYSNNAYDVSDLERLWRGVQRSVPPPYRMVVLIDEHYEAKIDRQDTLYGVTFAPFKGDGCGGWSNMLEAFRPWLRPQGDERVVLVGLDTVFVGDCSWLFEWDRAPVGLPWDPFETETVCDGVVSFDEPGAQLVWDAFIHERDRNQMKDHVLAGKPSEMMLLRALWRLHDWPTLEPVPRRLLSYKVHVKAKKMAWEDASIVYFHGKPKPKDLPEDHPIRTVWES